MDDSRQAFSLRAFSLGEEPPEVTLSTVTAATTSSVSAANTSSTNAPTAAAGGANTNTSSGNNGNSSGNHAGKGDEHHHSHHFVPHDLYKHPPSIVELTGAQTTTHDDTAIKRLTMGKVNAAFDSNQSATKTTPRRPSDKHYIAPTNTFIASNGDVYEIEPFVLPPPTEIAALFQELKSRRDRSDSNLGTESGTSPKHSQKDLNGRGSGTNLAARFDPSGSSSGMSFAGTTHGGGASSSSSSNNNNSNSNNNTASSSNGSNSRDGGGLSRSNSQSKGLNGLPDQSPDPKPLVRPPNIFTESKPQKHLGGGGGVSGGSTLASIAEDGDDYGSTVSGLHMRRQPAVAHAAMASTVNFEESLTNARRKRGGSLASDPSSPTKNQEYFRGNKFSLRNYLLREMLGIGEPGHLEPQAVGYMDNFLTVPSKVERLISFGFFICLDAFLYVLTVLPIRVVYSLGLLVCEVAYWLRKHVFRGPGVSKRGMSMMNEGFFHRSHLYDIMRGCFMLLGCFVLQLLNMSRVYHYIRGQTLIKLYVLTAMMEIFDKLLCSFGQDSFDSLYCLTLMRPEMRKIAFSFVITAVYVIFHSGMYFMYVATLTVAINSSDQALVTVLILNNFAEIKSFVFKKFDKQNLFQLSCSDITERFQLVLFLLCINSVALAQAGSAWLDVLPSHLMVFVTLVLGEAIADWIKHAFISKFNFINANVYDDFAKVLRRDILNNHKDKIILDQTYAITKRVGLAQIPLGCVFVRYMILAFSAPASVVYLATKTRLWLFSQVVSWFTLVFVTKVAIGVGLIFYSGAIHNKELRTKEDEERRLEEKTGKPRLERRASINQLSNIERYTVYKGRVVG
jgi:hypothetical protein